jgi:sulfur carrier protein ThiS
MPGRVNTYQVEEGFTVREVLNVANLDPAGYEVRINGAPAQLDQVVSADETILLVKQVKGNNTITVNAGRMPGRVNTYQVEEGFTVREVLSVANLDPAGYEVRINGAPAQLDQVVSADETILLVKQVKGNTACRTKDGRFAKKRTTKHVAKAKKPAMKAKAR